ncbi:MAG: hypothetical protein HQ582_27235 [Planctomycetes bacterium]|nr:hypothetical protein [Planctomycetota bacterium]
MAEERPERSESDSPSGGPQPCLQFGVRDILVLMLFTALVLGTYRVSGRLLIPIVAVFGYYVSRSVRWRGRPLHELSSPVVGRRGVTLFTWFWALVSGITNGALFAILLFLVVSFTTGVKIPFGPLMVAGAGAGLLLALAFPRFFSRFWPWPF